MPPPTRQTAKAHNTNAVGEPPNSSVLDAGEQMARQKLLFYVRSVLLSWFGLILLGTWLYRQEFSLGRAAITLIPLAVFWGGWQWALWRRRQRNNQV